MSGPVQENVYLQDQIRFFQQPRRIRQAFGIPSLPILCANFAYQNPCVLSPPHQPQSQTFYNSSLNRNRLLGVLRRHSMIHKLYQVRHRPCCKMCMGMARRYFGNNIADATGGGAQYRTRLIRASFLLNPNVPRQILAINNDQLTAAFTRFRDKSTSNLTLRSDTSVEIYELDEDEKLQHIEEQDDGLDLRLKL